MRTLRPALLLAVVLAAATAAPAEACPGATPSCPYSAVAQVGQRDGGVLRFPQAVAVAPDGTVYVGDQGSRAVQAFAPDGTFLRAIGRAGTRPGELAGVGALAVAGDGSLLVADGQNRIHRFAADGRHLTTWGRSGTDVGEFRFGGGRGNDAGAGGGLAVSGSTVYVADSGNDRIQRFDLDGGHGAVIVPPGRLAYPKGLAVRGTRLFVADNQNHRVLVHDTGGRLLHEVRTGAGRGGGPMQNPYGVAVDRAGRLYVSDNMGQRVLRFSTAATGYAYKARWGQYGTAPGRLAYPRAIATDAAGNVVVTNTGNDRVDVFDRGGGLLRSMGTSGRAGGQFGTPMGAAADASGMRAVTDSVNGRIQLLNPVGGFLAAWGSPAPGPTILPKPVAVAFDELGNAFVLDQRRARILAFDRATGLPVGTIGSQGSGPGRLQDPAALALDAAGVLYVADAGNSRIARFTVDGAYLGAITETGKGRGIAVTPDGSRIYLSDTRHRITAYDAEGRELVWFGGRGRALGKLEAPAQLALDAAGTLWVADRGNSRVQRFGPDGERLLMFGERGTGPGQFLSPTGISVDCRGLLTVSEAAGNRVQSFALTTEGIPPCRELRAPAVPPAPQLPTLPPPEGAALEVRVLRRSAVLTRGLAVRVGCDTRCTVTVTVRLTPRARPRKGRRPVAVTLRGATATLAAGESRVLRATASPTQRRALTRALRGSRGLRASLQLEAVTTDTGERSSSAQQVDVTR